MADDRKKRIEDINELENERIRLLNSINELLLQEMQTGEAIFDSRFRTVQQEEYIQNAKERILEYEQESQRLSEEGYEISRNVRNEIDKQRKSYNELNKEQEKSKNTLTAINGLISDAANSTKLFWDYLMQSDKAIKSTVLSLGLSGEKAEIMRQSFEGSAKMVARLGGNLEDVGTIMQTFADTTGRARILSSKMVEDVFEIGKGTGIGIEQASRLAAQFEFMGMDARATMDYVQGVVETSELMGVNTTKVLNNIANNYKELQAYNFRKGVQGFADMAQNAEKLRVDISSALDLAGEARNLENIVDMTAQLQVMGGKFAETDPFKMLYQARNAPEELQKSISDMTSGLVHFKKTSEGTIEKFISPADRDRLAQVAKSLGMTNEEMTEIAYRRAEFDKMGQQLIGKGFTDKQKELVKGMADYQSETGKFTVQIGQTTKDIRDLTNNELKILEGEKKSLKERAKSAQTFDEVYQATIQEFKAVLLPMLKGVNDIISTIRPVVTGFSDAIHEWNMPKFLEGAGKLLTGAILWKSVSAGLSSAASGLKNAAGRFTGRGGATAAKRITTTKTGSQALGAGKSAGARAAGRGSGMMKAGVGVGAAALGAGAGIGLAAEGISSLADSMEKLSDEKAETLKSIINTLAIAGGIAAGVAVLGGVFGAAAGPMLAFGGAALMVGSAIGIAAAGVGYMSEGLSTLIDSAKGAGPELFNIAGGIAAISGSLASMAIGGFGLPAFAATLGLITRKSDELGEIGTAFNNIDAVLSGSREDFEAVENAITKISNADLSNLKQFSQLNELLNKPIKVEFADKDVSLVSNITLNMDGYEMTQRIAERVPIVQKEMASGKESGRY